MISRIHASLAKRRAALEEGDAGFTLIELLVVVLIIGILAAIAIPVFLSQQAQAKDSAAKADLGSAKTAVIASATQNDGTYPAPGSLQTALSAYGFTPTQNDTVNLITSSASGICIEAQVTGGTLFHITDSVGVTTGGC